MVQNYKGILRYPKILTPEEYVEIYDEVVGAIIIYVKRHKPKSFTVKNLFGYRNKDWEGYSAQILYDKWMRFYHGDHQKAYKRAAISLGQIFKTAIVEMKDIDFKIDTSYNWNIRYIPILK